MGTGGVDMRKRGDKTRFLVGRLKTAKKDSAYGSEKRSFGGDGGDRVERRADGRHSGRKMGGRSSGRERGSGFVRARPDKEDGGDYGSSRRPLRGGTRRPSGMKEFDDDDDDDDDDGEEEEEESSGGRRSGRGRGVGFIRSRQDKYGAAHASSRRPLRGADTTSPKLRTRTRRPSGMKEIGDDDDDDDGEEEGEGCKDGRGFKKNPDVGKDSRSNERKGQGEKPKSRVKKTPSMDNSAADEQPKRKKRVIRLDPNDISNKRIVDSVPLAKETVEEKEDTELSKNAQFRAIQPSPSILSFVENNLLGRRRTFELKKAGYNVDLSAPLDNIPQSTSAERERIEESVFRNKLEFFAAAKISSSFPPSVLPEVAFAGRSNVGKSSLLNALTRQWGVVRTSDKPGLTQTINFFRLASKICMVDLPGYGFAYAKEEVKESWEELVKEYVATRDGLQRVCLLVDTKWGMKPRDHELVQLMERSKTPYQIVLTKTDLVFPMDVARRAMQIQEDLKKMKSKVDPVMMVSSKSGAGIRSLRTVLSKMARFIKP